MIKGKQGLQVMKFSDGSAILIGDMTSKMRKQFGDKTANSIEKAIKNKKPLNVGAMRAVLADSKNKTMQKQILDFVAKDGAPKGAKMVVRERGNKLEMSVRNPSAKKKETVKSERKKPLNRQELGDQIKQAVDVLGGKKSEMGKLALSGKKSDMTSTELILSEVDDLMEQLSDLSAIARGEKAPPKPEKTADELLSGAESAIKKMGETASKSEKLSETVDESLKKPVKVPGAPPTPEEVIAEAKKTAEKKIAEDDKAKKTAEPSPEKGPLGKAKDVAADVLKSVGGLTKDTAVAIGKKLRGALETGGEWASSLGAVVKNMTESFGNAYQKAMEDKNIRAIASFAGDMLVRYAGGKLDEKLAGGKYEGKGSAAAGLLTSLLFGEGAADKTIGGITTATASAATGEKVSEEKVSEAMGKIAKLLSPMVEEKLGEPKKSWGDYFFEGAMAAVPRMGLAEKARKEFAGRDEATIRGAYRVIGGVLENLRANIPLTKAYEDREAIIEKEKDLPEAKRVATAEKSREEAAGVKFKKGFIPSRGQQFLLSMFESIHEGIGTMVGVRDADIASRREGMTESPAIPRMDDSGGE